MSAVTFHVPGKPVGKGRARFSPRGGKVRTFTPERTVAFESLVAMKAEDAMNGRELMAGPVRMLLLIALPIAQSWSAKKKTAALAGALKPCSRPDLDNYIKSVADGCNGIVYGDDAQIVGLMATKRYDETPGVTVTVEAV